ncbi:MAG TPA: hypothetical protein VIL46_15015 [Gemmataceae bacterium]
MGHTTRREFLRRAAGVLAGAGLAGPAAGRLAGQEEGERPRRDGGVTVLNPQGRVPLSLIIDDSTCLVNLNRFAIPQFDDAWGKESRYGKYDWRKWPHEIPDAFVRKFGEWCAEHHIKGKYSVVPYPACVGRIDRVLPGWTQRELADSIKLVRELMLPGWDIHPEMVTHTRVIDTRTGHPYPEVSPRYMENWSWTDGRSVDELADYLSYALKILKNVGLPCEGITTPGGFAGRVVPQLARATLQSCRDVFGAEIPHYFKHAISSGGASVAPRVEYASGLETDDPRCVVSVIACTGDWTGGWDCSDRGHPDRFITPDLRKGRLVEVIERGEPAVLLCHWTGIYFNGEEVGFRVFREVVRRVHERYDHLLWMKLSEIARYWAAKELTRIERQGDAVALHAPFASPRFTLRAEAKGNAAPELAGPDGPAPLREVRRVRDLKPGTWLRDGEGVVVCFDLPKGRTRLRLRGGG